MSSYWCLSLLGYCWICTVSLGRTVADNGPLCGMLMVINSSHRVQPAFGCMLLVPIALRWGNSTGNKLAEFIRVENFPFNSRHINSAPTPAGKPNVKAGAEKRKINTPKMQKTAYQKYISQKTSKKYFFFHAPFWPQNVSDQGLFYWSASRHWTRC